jgi:hypothetical protein
MLVLVGPACQRSLPTAPTSVIAGSIPALPAGGAAATSRAMPPVFAHCLNAVNQPECLAPVRHSSQVAGGLPDPPTLLSATVNGTSVTLTWVGPPPVDATLSYVIEAGTQPGITNLVSFPTGTTSTSFLAVGVASGTYFVRIRAANAVGIGGASNEVTVVVGGGPCVVPGAPGSMTIVSNVGGTVVLAWQAAAGSRANTSSRQDPGRRCRISRAASSDLSPRLV